MEALPYVLVTAVSTVFYKTFNFSNAAIAFYTSLFTLPWLFKPALAPMLEKLASKRILTVLAEFALVVLFFLLATSLYLKNFFYPTILVFFMIAIASTIHDMNADGLYIISLEEKAQAHFIGIRTLFYQAGKLACQGALVSIAGFLIIHFDNRAGWQVAFALLASVTLALALYHTKILPQGEIKVASKGTQALHSFSEIFTDLKNSPHIISKLFFALFYNFSEAQLAKIVPLFLLDKISNGGLGLSIEQVGMLYGGLGVTGMLCGIIASGFILSRVPLKTCLVPITILVGISNLGYLLLSIYGFQQLALISLFVVTAHVCFGLCNGAYMMYLLRYFGQGRYPMSFYAIGTAVMGLGYTFGGMASGYVQKALGYTHFFYWILLVDIGIALLTVYNSKKVLKEV